MHFGRACRHGGVSDEGVVVGACGLQSFEIALCPLVTCRVKDVDGLTVKRCVDVKAFLPNLLDYMLYCSDFSLSSMMFYLTWRPAVDAVTATFMLLALSVHAAASHAQSLDAANRIPRSTPTRVCKRAMSVTANGAVGAWKDILA